MTSELANGRSLDAVRADFADLVADVIHDRDLAPSGADLARLEQIARTMDAVTDADLSLLGHIDDELGGAVRAMIRVQLMAISVGAFAGVTDAPGLYAPIIAWLGRRGPRLIAVDGETLQ